jgi:cytochrome oxidase Cu insertion factor (SCO1/SenC/PrrC family)
MHQCAKTGSVWRRVLLLPLLLAATIGCSLSQTEKDEDRSATDRAASSGTAAASPDDMNQERAADKTRVLFTVPEFHLTDQTGAPFGSDDLAGRVWIANFMFTRGTATSPRQTERIGEILRHVRRWPDGERLRYVSFTVDPEYDSPPRLHEYAEMHGADHTRWKFLTGSREELHAISSKGFHLPVGVAPGDAKSRITHSSRFALVNRQRSVRGLYESLDDGECQKLLADMRTVLSEFTPDSDEIVHVSAPPGVFDSPWLDRVRDAQLAAAGEIEAAHDFRFVDRREESGISFLNRVVSDATRHSKLNHYDHGTGLAVADIDGDGLPDLYFVNQVGGNELWRNRGGGQFENITEQAGVGLAGRVCVGASFADTDNDGDPDLFVTTTRHGNAFFVNDGRGRFRDATDESGLTYSGHSSSADFFDYDRDGRLDLFLTNVGMFTIDEIGYSRDKEGHEHPYYIGRRTAFAGHLYPSQSERSILYHNEGGSRFRDVSAETGLVHDRWSGDATPIDANDDGWIDLYVVTMQGNDEYYENVGGKQFVRRSEQVFPRSPWGGMSVNSFDFNNDGRMDLFITNMHADMWRILESTGPAEKLKAPFDALPPERFLNSRTPGLNIYGNALFQNVGAGRFQEISDQVNAENYWPWGLSVGDLNADGFQDVFIACSMNLGYRYQPNSLLLNDGGKRFRDAEFILGVEPRRNRKTATEWFEFDRQGADAGNPLWKEITGRAVVWAALGTRSAAIFDLDDDGDLDIVTNDFNSPPMVLISDLAQRNPNLHYVQISLRGAKSNRDGLGAKVQVTAAGHTFTQVLDGQSGYLSQSTLPLYFGLGDAAAIDSITIRWPSGEQQRIEGPIPANRQLVIEEGTGIAPRR